MHHRPNASATLLLALLMPLSLAAANNFYVSPGGSSAGNGSIGNPWDLQTALSQPAPVKPGDTIWLRGGTYYGMFTSSLTGSASAPIIVRQYAGERATIDGPASASNGALLSINGAWTWYWGFEVICSDPNRYISRATALNVYAPNTRFINLVIHDTGQGMGFWQPATDSTIYGSVIYNNGFEGSDRGHGHSIYTQNQTGTKHILDNIFFQSFSVGLHAYSESGYLNNLDVEGNIAFNHGTVSAAGAKHNLLIGGGPVAQNPAVINNYTYYPAWATSGRNELGYGSGCNNLTMTGNYFSQPNALTLNCTNVTMTGNTLDGAIAGFTSSQYPSNTYIGGRPTGTTTYVRPNAYEAGRANIVVYNWDNLSSVQVNVSGVLKPGDTYEVRDAQNFYGPPVASGTYTGAALTLPTVLTQVAPTIGAFPVPPVHTASEFNAYVLLPRSTGTSTNLAPSVNAGGNQAITLPASALLGGTVSDDGLPNKTLTVLWSKVSGPGTVSFSAATSASTTAAFSAAGTYVLQLWASDGALSATSQLTVVVSSAAVSTGSATFVKTDTTTLGNWKGIYGADGALVIGDSTALPSYASVTASGQNAYTWIGTTSDQRAPTRISSSTRIAATWYSSTSYLIDVNQSGATAHQLAVYCLDWDGAGARAERIDVIDAGTGAVIDSRTVSSFSNGQYLVWNVTGHVILRVVRTAGSNAVISGLFWGAGRGTTPPPAPAASATAQFVKIDTATKGTWKSVYGTGGGLIASDASSLPAPITVVPGGANAYVWAPTTADTRALQHIASTTRLASTWFSSTGFDLDVTIGDAKAHRIALYCVDWDSGGVRSQRVSVLDAATGTVLDTRPLSSFSGGDYLVWTISGHVVIRLTNVQGSNAVASGLFID